MLGCGLPGGEQGYNMGRVVAVLLGMDHLPGTTITRYCSSSLQTTRMALHAIKAGEGDVFISAGVEMVSRFVKGNSDSLPDTQNPLFADAEARTAKRRRGRRGQLARPARGRRRSPTSTSRWARPPRTSRCSRASPAQEHGRVRRPRRRTWPRRPSTNGFWEREITPVTLPDGTVVSKDDGPRAGTTLEGVAGSSRCSAPTARSPPATAARSTTAPPRWSS